MKLQRTDTWKAKLDHLGHRINEVPSMVVEGKLTRMVGLTLEAVGCQAAIGEKCLVAGQGGVMVEAEVVGFSGDKLYLMPIDTPQGLEPNARVIPQGKADDVAVGKQLLGRVIDGAGRPLDGKGKILSDTRVPLAGKYINPLDRRAISEPLDVGIRSINALMTIGRGQRMGLFAPSGVGKSSLLGMMTRFTDADVIVVGLIGERGREVKEFIENILGIDGRERSVVVATPADTPPLMRLHGASLATSIAEYFRDQGNDVLLLMDSLTRYAQAQREIALTIGEPPATRGYPPSVFAKLPHLVERAGNGGIKGGSITAIYTVLTDVDDANDPISEAARAILDGHIVLSRTLAESGHYPAIDPEASISRVMNQVTDSQHQQYVSGFKHFYSLFEQNRDLFSVGAYKAGSDQSLDFAIGINPHLKQFLRQDMNEKVTLSDSMQILSKTMTDGV